MAPRPFDAQASLHVVAASKTQKGRWRGLDEDMSDDQVGALAAGMAEQQLREGSRLGRHHALLLWGAGGPGMGALTSCVPKLPHSQMLGP